MISLLLTNVCNLACEYCYVSGGKKIGLKKNNLSFDFAKAGIDDYFEQNIPAIRFFGEGEPTLEFNLMKNIWSYAYKASAGYLKSELQTNGCFSDYIAEWVADHIDTVWISADGPPYIHDKYRPRTNGGKSSIVVRKNIEILKKYGKKVGVRATIGSLNVYRQIEVIDYFNSLGVDAVFADPICSNINMHVGDRKVKDHNNLMEYAKSFCVAKEYADKIGLFYSNYFIANFDEQVEYSCRAMIPEPHLCPSGYISCCDMVTDITGTALDDFIYGYYDKKKGIRYYKDKIRRIRSRSIYNIPECSECEIRYSCGGGCAGELINETGNFYGIDKVRCQVTKYFYSKVKVNKDELFSFIHP